MIRFSSLVELAMHRNVICSLGGLAFALYLFLPAPLRLYVPAGFAVPVVVYLLAPLAYRRLARGDDLTARELFVAVLLTVFLALLAVLPFLKGPVAVVCVVAMAALLYGGLPSAESAEDLEIAESPSET
jgi:hypothetical protein